jgi:hypothetical protein
LNNRKSTPENFIKKLQNESDFEKKTLWVIGYLFDALQRKGMNSCLVDGGAIELYTAGQFTTGAIDVTTSDKSAAEEMLGKLDFKKEGMIWVNDELEIAFQIVGRHPSRTGKLRTVVVGDF